jgi:hypothetical protein
MTYQVFERLNLDTPKRRVMADLAFASLTDAIDHFTNLGGYAEMDADGADAADVFTKGGIVLTVERAA